MNWIKTVETLNADDRGLIGGKAWRMARLQQLGFRTAPFVVVTTGAYDAFLDDTGLRERIALELNRKAFEEMRWEEIWDCATRIRHLFLTTPMPASLRAVLAQAIASHVGDRAVAVRSSAIDEDTRQASFAGLHASFINIRGADAVIRHIRLVWASLWSDAALLYRQEIGLDVAQSAMAVLVQRLVVGTSSGVAFTVHPSNPQHAVIEAVHGLNQGLVDGSIEPDRWEIQRDTGEIISRTEPERHRYIIPAGQDVRNAKLPPELAARPPLSGRQVGEIWEQAREVASAFDAPQDVEWTLAEDGFTLLQTRPISTGPDSADDQRGWYLSLHKSYDQLIALRHKIEHVHIPGMIAAAQELSGVDPKTLSTEALGQEIKRRWNLTQHWTAVYWSDFIPYAHGIRLFGQYYNDRLAPEDPYEFMDLLTQTDMQSLERNHQLQELADMVASDPGLLESVSDTLDQSQFERRLGKFLDQFGDLSSGATGGRRSDEDLRPLLGLITEMARRPAAVPASAAAKDPADLKQRYLQRFPQEEQAHAEAVLDLARSSYQLRDDDNIHLGRIEAGFMAALQEGQRRIDRDPRVSPDDRQVLQAIVDDVAPAPGARPDAAATAPAGGRFRFQQRQLVGQPAGPGLAQATARVITEAGQLTAFKAGEILVCDAVDPNMTFVVPLATGIIERRGGMLIHGAIIAREYGLPCITGVPQATTLIKTGDAVTVDGYLGIVTIG
jgi:phosphohistidine swiveling domain-containing protein